MSSFLEVTELLNLTLLVASYEGYVLHFSENGILN